MKFFKTIFASVFSLVTINSLVAMDRPVFDARQLHQAMYAGQEAFNARLQNQHEPKNDQINEYINCARRNINSLQQAMNPELDRRVALHQGHTVAPLMHTLLFHADHSLQPVQQHLQQAPLYDAQLDGIPDHGIVLALGAHAEGLAILERLFGIINNKHSAFNMSGRTFTNVVSENSWGQKVALLSLMKDHYSHWFDGRPHAEPREAARPVSSTCALPAVTAVHPADESGASSTALAAPAQVQVLCAKQLKDAAYCREYLHDLYMQLLIALGNVDLLLDELAYRLPREQSAIAKQALIDEEDLVQEQKPLVPLIDGTLNAATTLSGKLAGFCHSFAPTLDTTILHLRRNRTALRDVAQRLTPSLASGIQAVMSLVSGLGKGKDAYSSTKSAAGTVFYGLHTVMTYLSPSHESADDIDDREMEKKNLEEKNKQALIVAPPHFSCDDKEGAQSKKTDEEDEGKADTQQVATDLVQLVANIRAMLEDLSPIIEECLKTTIKVRNFTKNSEDGPSIQSTLQEAEPTITAIVHLTERLRNIVSHRFTRDESFGSQDFRAMMEDAAQAWQNTDSAASEANSVAKPAVAASPDICDSDDKYFPAHDSASFPSPVASSDNSDHGDPADPKGKQPAAVKSSHDDGQS